MAQSAYPFSNQDVNEDQFSAWANALVGRKSFVVAGNKEGVSETALQVGTGTGGMTLSVQAGAAIVRGFYYLNTAVVTLTFDASTGQPRKDLVIVRIDPTTDTAGLAVLKGTAAASPVRPTLDTDPTGIFEFPLAEVTIGAGVSSLNAGNAVDIRRLMPRGVEVWTNNSRPTTAEANDHEYPVLGYNSDTQAWEFWNGSAYVGIMNDASKLTTGTLTRPSSGDHTGLVKGKGYDVQQVAPTPVGVGHVWISW